jgi:hypothetical protein
MSIKNKLDRENYDRSRIKTLHIKNNSVDEKNSSIYYIRNHVARPNVTMAAAPSDFKRPVLSRENTPKKDQKITKNARDSSFSHSRKENEQVFNPSEIHKSAQRDETKKKQRSSFNMRINNLMKAAEYKRTADIARIYLPRLGTGSYLKEEKNNSSNPVSPCLVTHYLNLII